MTQLSLISEYFMRHYKPLPDWPSVDEVPFFNMTDEKIEARLSEIWNPANWSNFEPSQTLMSAGRELSRYILPEHVKLVA